MQDSFLENESGLLADNYITLDFLMYLVGY